MFFSSYFHGVFILAVKLGSTSALLRLQKTAKSNFCGECLALALALALGNDVFDVTVHAMLSTVAGARSFLGLLVLWFIVGHYDQYDGSLDHDSQVKSTSFLNNTLLIFQGDHQVEVLAGLHPIPVTRNAFVPAKMFHISENSIYQKLSLSFNSSISIKQI